MPPTTVYRTRIRTDSADSNALMLVADGELIAILVELADDGHGHACGHWTIEVTFGLNSRQRPGSFVSADHAAEWVSKVFDTPPFEVNQQITELV